ncbi:MAG: FtsX-like permease family protein [Bacteroidota bacterium]
MLKNYFKIAFRNLIKNRSHTLINIGGLSLGITCAVIVFLVIQYDLSFDTWHQNKDRVYRVVRYETDFGNEDYDRGGPYLLAEGIRSGIDGVETTVLVNTNFGAPVFTLPEASQTNKFSEGNTAMADPGYFRLFDYRWLSGNPDNALEDPNTVVITRRFANRVFGTTDVLGKELVMNTGEPIDLVVTGVVEDPPANSDYPFLVIGSSSSVSRNGTEFGIDNWGSNSSSWQTYVLLNEGVTKDHIDAQFDDLITKHRGAETAEVLDFFLQPMQAIHFDSRFDTYNGRVVEQQTLWTLAIIGFLLILAACINFINLNTALAVRRSKEVGLRKTLGGTRSQLIVHFLSETAVITFISLLIAVGATEFSLRFIEPILGFTLPTGVFNNTALILFLIGVFLLTTLMAGLYPAYYLSRFNPIKAIKNNLSASYTSGLSLRRGLIVTQFAITQALVICTLIIANQTRFFKSEDLGIQKEALVEVSIPYDDKATLDTFKQQLVRSNSIHSVTFSNSGSTNGNVWGGNYYFIDDTLKTENGAEVKFGDEDYVSTYGLTLLAGTNYRPSDTTNAYLVNESFARQVGYGDRYTELLGKEVRFWGKQASIVGVVKDFNTQSLHTQLAPVVITPERNYTLSGIKINTAQTSEAIELLEATFNEHFPDHVADYEFLDERIASMYEDEERTRKIMNVFTGIAILIGALGLIGLISYMATTKTKEIGVRKVLGASMGSILTIFGKEIIVLTSISFFIAAPVAWYVMNGWLSNFAYKIPLSPTVFLLSFLCTLLLAFITVAYRSIKAALSNPIISLKTEQ